MSAKRRPCILVGRPASFLPGSIRCVQALFLPDEKRLWRGSARREAPQIVDDGECSAVLDPPALRTRHTSSPATSLLARGFPWIADFRDPWVDNCFFTRPTPLHAHLQKRWERRVTSPTPTASLRSATQWPLDPAHPALRPAARPIRGGFPTTPTRRTCPRRPLVAVRTARSRLRPVGTFQGSIHARRFPQRRLPRHPVRENPRRRSRSQAHWHRRPSRQVDAAAAGIPGVVREDGFLPHRLALQTASSADAAPPDSAQWPAGGAPS